MRSVVNQHGSIYPFYFFTKHYRPTHYKLISSDWSPCLELHFNAWIAVLTVLVRISNELQIALFNRQLSDLISQ